MLETKINPTVVQNFLTAEELKDIQECLQEQDHSLEKHVDQDLGRVRYEGLKIPLTLEYRLTNYIRDVFGLDLIMNLPPQYVEYNKLYGEPKLEPHYDRDFNELIVDYQFESNTKWPLGADEKIFSLEDNGALMFNPNQSAHWRPQKTFKDGEYVRMIFFRFFVYGQTSDYSHLPDNSKDSAFDRVNAYRDAHTLD